MLQQGWKCIGSSHPPARALCALLLVALVAHGTARAEPYLAVANGFKCVQCHVNPTGGSMRGVFGNVWAQTQMPGQRLDGGGEPWTGQLNRYLAVGADLRFDAWAQSQPGKKSDNRFEYRDSHVYLGATVIPERLLFYFDEHVLPGSPFNLEAWALFWAADHSWYLKAGQMYLPFGLRLQDQTSFVVDASRIDMTAPGRGVEFGWLKGRWDAQLALSNGTGTDSPTSTGKEVTAQVAYVEGRWRLGLAGDHNDALAGGRRETLGLFGGLKTGPIAWLAEADVVTDHSLPGQPRRLAGLLEANYSPARGHNLKVSAEYYDQNRNIANNRLHRLSAVYELAPVQFVQLRLGARFYNGAGQPLDRLHYYFLELHGFF